MSNLQRFQELAEKYAARWPELEYRGGGGRASAAVALAAAGQAKRLGTLTSGSDRWQVERRYQCSIKDGTCDCADRAAPVDARFGKLCKHRIACMMVASLERDDQGGLIALLREIGADEIRLFVTRIYRDGEDRKILHSWHVRGQQPVEIGGQMAVTNEQLLQAMEKTGYTMVKPPSKCSGFRYLYELVSVEGAQAGAAMGTLYGTAPADAETKRYRELEQSANERNLAASVQMYGNNIGVRV